MGMLTSLISVCTFSNVIYTNFIGPPNMFCTYYRQRWVNYVRWKTRARIFPSAFFITFSRASFPHSDFGSFGCSPHGSHAFLFGGFK